MKKIILLFVFSMALFNAFSQGAKSVYFELGGPGLASFNFDTRFSNREDGIGGRIGIGGFSIEGESLLAIPAALNFLVGKDGKHYFEVGAGATYINYNSDFNNDGTFESSFGHLNFGYRLQPTNGGFLFRAAIVPVFNKHGFIPYYAGVSFGYKFGSKRAQ